ncbi:hypothetical protein ASG17_01670 [Brevundimonas sp. Leaf363]|uniref:hybrid sensor histidine kinase/response regulator n=1 Tax=Brevundimonas sp. Leaf363 TaxID=1736353 RepID=UPI0007000CE2|nr:response regulator [Brevundimonas sp. Leaf363]KQS57457.1 hypothetical protein ASG17_01670 [Brevundimonas sp. Leaf363]
MQLILLLLSAILATGFAGLRLWLKARTAPHPAAARAWDLENRLAAAEAALERRVGADHDAAALVSGLAVEARTPLNAVIGFSELMRLNRAQEPLTVRQAQAVDQILASGRALLSLLDEVSDLARLQAGVLPLAPERVDPRLIARQVCDRLRPEAEAAGVILNAPKPGAGPVVRADRSRLRQLLMTLVANAIATNRPGGAVYVEVRAQQGCAVVCVHDTGLGVPDDRMADLFQPFSDAAGPGSGAGLAVGRALAQAMEGDLHAVSRPGEGSTFTLTLPVAQAAPDLPRIVPAPPRTLPAATLLYVEDNASNIALMRRVLGLIGPQLSLHVAEDGFQGLALARDLRPDVVLTDINLPGMDGFELRRRLAQEPLTQDTPVLALSARALADDRRRGLEAGFVDYLAKPLDIAALADALALALAPLIGQEAGGLEEAA